MLLYDFINLFSTFYFNSIEENYVLTFLHVFTHTVYMGLIKPYSSSKPWCHLYWQGGGGGGGGLQGAYCRVLQKSSISFFVFSQHHMLILRGSCGC